MGTPHNVTLKLNRATEHVEALQAAQQDFLAGEPYRARRTIEGGASVGEGTDHVFRWERYTPPPDSLGLLVGDAIHNARCALDHLVVALAEHGARAAGITMTPKWEARLQFPIVASHDEFVEQVGRGRLHLVARTARTAIEGYQPYRVSTDPERAHLMQLTRLDNTDKHRAIIASAHAISLGLVGDQFDTKPEFPSGQSAPGQRYGEPGTEIFRLPFPIPKREVDVPCEVNFGITLADYPPLIEMPVQVRELVKTTGLTVARIAAACLP